MRSLHTFSLGSSSSNGEEEGNVAMTGGDSNTMDQRPVRRRGPTAASAASLGPLVQFLHSDLEKRKEEKKQKMFLNVFV